MKENLLKIINHYGMLSQLKYFQSEIFELNEAIIKHSVELDNFDEDYDYNNGLTLELLNLGKQQIAEEIADCYVMLEQFRLYHDIEIEEIKNIMEYKINRQLKRMEEEVNE